MLRRMFRASATYTVLGLASGLYYRELTRGREGVDFGQLSVAHTHFLVLGTVVGLIVMILERQFRLSESRFARSFEITWHLGVVLTALLMLWTGTMTTLGIEFNEKMFAGISGSGHILLSVSFLLLFLSLAQQLKREQEPDSARSILEEAKA